MADQLNPIVQKMIDAGESEENIATVIQHYKSQAPGPSVVSPDEPGTFQGGAAKSIRETVGKTGMGILHGLNPIPAIQSIWNNGSDALPYKPEDTPASAMARLKANDVQTGPSAMESVKGLSDPETGGQAIGNLLQAGMLGRVVSGARSPAVRGSVGRAMQTVGDNVDVTKPLKMLSTAGRALEQSAQPPVEPPAGPTGPHLDRSAPMRPGEMTQQQIGERLKFGTGEPPPKVEKSPLGGRLPMSAEPLQPIGQQRPPITVSPESPMQEPRAQVGAEVVGRQNGMTTQQVRDTTGPIRGEAPGAAAGMPNKPMDRIVQKLIDMGPKGQGLPESAREGYAAAATSDKARLQIQAYLDALRKVGFVGAGAAAPALMRGKLVSGIQDQQ